MVKRAARVAAAVGIGYLLGRRRKLQLALTLGAAAAAGRLSGDSGRLLRRGTESLLSSPELGKLSGLSRPLVGAAKAAAMTAVSSRVDAFSDQLQDRAEMLRRGPSAGSGRSRARSEADDPDDRRDSDDRYDSDDRRHAEDRYDSDDRDEDEPYDAHDEPEDDARDDDEYADEDDDREDEYDDEDDDRDDVDAGEPEPARQRTTAVVRRRRR
ncbi:hypothetical protein SAMN05444365_105320 [Micromonospora pattaloongensis]|uniref:DNA primase n=1 Tax=Micromonospora pattaloongensis TaxID=405436 RepID=A0A1H3QAB5_9ACTN|nr:hypothetical protein [Micromonospora pattaloongensis]SDZ10091.1 hypothetical protein SAMN05444365_105320 [Micromonospora pattaloongensis]